MTDDKKRIEHLREVNEYFGGLKSDDVNFLLAQLDKAHEALRFYADSERWKYGLNGDDQTYDRVGFVKDLGNKAREALGEE